MSEKVFPVHLTIKEIQALQTQLNKCVPERENEDKIMSVILKLGEALKCATD